MFTAKCMRLSLVLTQKTSLVIFLLYYFFESKTNSYGDVTTIVTEDSESKHL